MIAYGSMPSPVGRLLLAANERGLILVHFDRGPGRVDPAGDWEERDAPVLRETRRQLEHYFAGRLRVFDVPLAPAGTAFQQRVWRALCEVPYGTTCSYGDVARRLGAPKATRAVGAANGRNPIPVIVPCHRVIGADGSLTGYGGGIDIKRFLLRLEGALDGELFRRG